MSRTTWNILMIALLAAAGCGGPMRYFTEERLAKGLVIILPGIEGRSEYNRDIQKGLVLAEVDRALPIYPWGSSIPIAGMLINQMDVPGNRAAAADIARMIVRYQDSHPRRPVHIVGHSGGGGIAVFAVEELPAGRKVDGLILLSPSLSPGYDLTKALGRCRSGIVSFYSPADIGLLVIGTSIAGNVDGTWGPAAGAVGFKQPAGSNGREAPAAYRKLYEVELRGNLKLAAHATVTRMSFVWTYVAPWIQARAWPPLEDPFIAQAKDGRRKFSIDVGP